MQPKKLTDRVALVTGAAQGMGQAIAQALAAEGARVVACDVKQYAIERVATEVDGVGLVVDVTDEQQVDGMVDEAIERFGRVDILINNAGILYPTRIDELGYDEWRRVLDVNLNGAFLCIKAALGPMQRQRFGRIVNISSSAGRSVSTLGGAHYTTSKAGLLGLTRAVAREVGGQGITVNAICPGLIDTEMVRRDCTPEQIAAYEESFPIPRLGTPDEVAKLALHIVADAPYTTGAAFDINGGDLMI